MHGNSDESGSDPAASVDCSVLVPVRNEEEHLVQSVAAMRRQRFAGQLEFVIVDDGSGDRTPELLADLAANDRRIRVLRNPRRGTPSALNLALANARGRWVCRMDAHTIYPEDYVALGVQRLGRGDTGWVSGPQVAVGHGRVSRAVELALRSRLGRGASRRWGASDSGAQQEYELDSGVFAGVWDRSVLLEFGGWDERWLRNQDSELAGRFHERGERIMCIPAMASSYAPRDSLRALWTQYIQYGEFRARTARRHPQTMRRSHLLPPALVACLPASIVAPRALRLAARAALVAYVATISAAAVRTEGADAGDAAMVPVVLATMHIAHGVGSYIGAARYGPPLSALASVFGLGRIADALAPPAEPVFAPSLRGC
jgi:glycosyltransferase involved in cell wall biosynthesis